MWRTIMGAGVAIWISGAALAQSAGQPSFEVASVKPAPPPSEGRIMVGMSGGPGTRDPGQISYNNVTLRAVMAVAYDVKDYQITGPDWLDSQRYIINAKIPPDTGKEQFRLMLQNLLAERFKLTLHRQTKDLPMYALVVAKGGPKMKQSVDDPNAPPADGPGGGGARGGITTGRDGTPQLGPGRRGALMMFSPKGMHVQMNHESMPQLAQMLSNMVSRPVLDETGLKGNYESSLDFAPDETTMGMMKGMPMPMPPPGGAPGGSVATPAGGPAPPQVDPGSAPSLLVALQEQLGLKLEARKGPVEMLVIDTAEKVPTEN